MALAWSWLYYRVSKVPVLGICVFSHWILDLVAHLPDLPIIRGGPYVGLGLWRFRDVSFIVESVLLIVGLVIYLRATRAKSPAGRYAMSAFVALLVVVEAVNIYGPPPPEYRDCRHHRPSYLSGLRGGCRVARSDARTSPKASRSHTEHHRSLFPVGVATR